MRRAFLCLSLLWLASCAQLKKEDLLTYDVSAESPDRYLGLPLKSGQIVVSGSQSTMGIVLAVMAENFSPYEHAGVLSIEADGVYVYEQFASTRPHMSGPPTDAMEGQVRRRPLGAFIRNYPYVAIYEHDTVALEPVHAYARARMEDKTPFDAYFDYSSHETLYCTEYVALALEAGGHASFQPLMNRNNPSLKVVTDWMGISNRILRVNALVESARPVALLSTKFSPQQLRLAFELKRELHRRFTCDQKFGNLVYWGNSRLNLRDAPKKFLEQGMTLFSDYTQEQDQQVIQREVRQLANRLLGEFSIESSYGACTCSDPGCGYAGR